MRKIPLTRGKFALVDEKDFEVLSRWKWQVSSDGYAVHSTHAGNKSIQIKMHRFILEAKKGEIVDHIDGNRLNNQRANLRIVSHSVNIQNRRNGVDLIGVRWVETKKKFVSVISVKRQANVLGFFDHPFEAALAYDEAALKYYGDDAATNAKIFGEVVKKKSATRK